MGRCDVCGGAFVGECPFGKGKELPWAEDYAQMGLGKMDHAEHQLNVARWVLHGQGEHSESVVLWAKQKIQVE